MPQLGKPVKILFDSCLLGLLGALVGWLAMAFHVGRSTQGLQDKVDAVERIAEQAREDVGTVRSSLSHSADKVDRAITRMHQDLKQDILSSHKRIDDLYRAMSQPRSTRQPTGDRNG